MNKKKCLNLLPYLVRISEDNYARELKEGTDAGVINGAQLEADVLKYALSYMKRKR